jgi:hypothetical protein
MASLATDSISTGSFKQRRTSGNKRLPWEDANENQSNATNLNQIVPKVMRSREVAPLKAFPLTDELDFVNGTLNNNHNNNTNNVSNKPSSYPASTSYQEKYLKKLQLNNNDSKLAHQNFKNDSHQGIKGKR